ncbi:MAG: divalent-cation tolerance protein CutA [Deltaproteobacteria bacterium]|nr:divalent-cation tolerance protein CutA [Deltaproteobacteria bacterium]
MGERYILVFSTVPSPEEGARIGKAVVGEGLAACCNIIPGLRSIYLWKGKLCDEGEALCLLKTRAQLFDRLKDRIKELHTYEVPEIVAIDIKDGLREYLSWIGTVTEGP